MKREEKIAKLAELKREIIDKKVCFELAKTASQLVAGEGDVDVELFFIGEAPGKKEDEEGRPFIGAAGKFLSEMLASINLSRDDVYITNIVKYRPPSNRDPLVFEKEQFTPYLLRELTIIQPKVIVTLGRHSMEYFLPSGKISQIHGEFVDVSIKQTDGTLLNQKILPLYHPAAALYNGSLRQTLLDDFFKLKNVR